MEALPNLPGMREYWADKFAKELAAACYCNEGWCWHEKAISFIGGNK